MVWLRRKMGSFRKSQPRDGTEAARLRKLLTANGKKEEDSVRSWYRTQQVLLDTYGDRLVGKVVEAIIEHAETVTKTRRRTSMDIKFAVAEGGRPGFPSDFYGSFSESEAKKIETAVERYATAVSSAGCIDKYANLAYGIAWVFTFFQEPTRFGHELIRRLRAEGFSVNYQPGVSWKVDPEMGAAGPVLTVSW